MTTFLYTNSKIAAGNDNAVSLVSWESIVTTDGVRFIAPVVYGNALLGEEHTNTDGSFYFSGYASSKNAFGYATQDQFYYTYTTILSGAFWGYVTVEMRLFDPRNYHIYNAILKIEQLQQQTKKGQAFDQFKFNYTRLVQLS